MPYGPLASTDRYGNLSDGHPCLQEGLEVIARQASPRRELLTVRGRQAMLPNPVANRGFMQADASADLGKRQSLAQEPLERRTIHSPNSPRRLGRNSTN